MTDNAPSLTPEIPAPMSWLTRDKIAPETEKRQRELRERLRLYSEVGAAERIRLHRRYKMLWAKLERAHWNEMVRELQARELECDQLYDAGITLKRKLALQRENNEAVSPDDVNELRDLWQTYRDMKRLKARIEQRMRPHENTWIEFSEVKFKLDGDRAERERQYNHRMFQKEAKTVATLIRRRWKTLKGCHYKKPRKDGGYRAIAPSFDVIRSDPYSHWLKIKTAVRTITGDFIPVMPSDIFLDTLHEERVLSDISAAVGQTVTWQKSRFSEEHWYKVNRLEQPGGLPEIVYFQQCLDFYPEAKHHLVPFPVGVVENGMVEWATFGDFPHILVAGTTGSGKSNFLKVMISTLLLTQSPEEVRLFLFDLKGGTDMRPYRDVPHVVDNIVKFSEDVLPRLKRLIKSMRARQALFESRGFENIIDHNRRVNPENRLPREVVIIDEMQGLTGLGTLTRKIHNALALLLAQGRAFGIHCVLCTQYPNKVVIPSSIKGNAPMRIAYATTDIAGSILMVGSKAAFELPKVKGRNIVSSGADRFEAQFPFIPLEQKEIAIRKAARWGDRALPFPEYDEIVRRELLEAAAEEGEEIEAPGITRTINDEEPVLEVNPKNHEMTHEEFVALAIEALDGKLSPRAAHEYLGEDSPGIRYMQRLHNEIVEPGTVIYRGETYMFGKRGKATVLKRVITTPVSVPA